MAKSIMSKSQTGVFLFFYTMFLFLSAAVLAEDVRPSFGSTMPSFCTTKKENGGTSQLEDYIELQCRSYRENNQITNKYEKCKDKALQVCSPSVNSDTRKCENSAKNFDTAKKEFIKACADAKVKAGGRTGDIGCSESMRKCTSCAGGSDGESLRADVTCDSTDVASDSGGNNSADILGSISRSIAGAGSSSTEIVDMTPDLSESRAQYANCPALAGAELKQWQDEYKESKKTVEDLQAKITKLQQELSDMQGKAEEENTKLQEQADDIQSKAKEDAQKAKEQLDKDQMRMAEKIEQLNDEITKENSALRQMDIGRIQAQTAFADTVSRLDLQCHASALQRLEAERQKKLQQIDRSEYSAGDMNSLFSGVGLSSRQKGQQMANEYFEFCKQDKAYTMASKSAKAAFDLALEQAAEGRRNIQARIASIQKRIDYEKNTVAYKNAQMTYDHLVKIQENMNKALDKLTRQRNQLQQQYTRNYQLKNKDLQQQQAKLAEEENYLKKKKEFLAMKTKMSKGIATTEDKVSDAMGKYVDLNSQSKAVMNDCTCISDPLSGACSAALAFLRRDSMSDLPVEARTELGTGSKAPDGTNPGEPSGHLRVPAGQTSVTVPNRHPRPAPQGGTR